MAKPVQLTGKQYDQIVACRTPAGVRDKFPNMPKSTYRAVLSAAGLIPKTAEVRAQRRATVSKWLEAGGPAEHDSLAWQEGDTPQARAQVFEGGGCLTPEVTTQATTEPADLAGSSTLGRDSMFNSEQFLFVTGLDLAGDEEPALRWHSPEFLRTQAEDLEVTFPDVNVVQGYARGLRIIAGQVEDEREA